MLKGVPGRSHLQPPLDLPMASTSQGGRSCEASPPTAFGLSFQGPLPCDKAPVQPGPCCASSRPISRARAPASQHCSSHCSARSAPSVSVWHTAQSFTVSRQPSLIPTPRQPGGPCSALSGSSVLQTSTPLRVSHLPDCLAEVGIQETAE